MEVGELGSGRHDLPLHKLFLELRVKDGLHRLPEGLLPLEHRLLGHDVRYDPSLEAPPEEDAGEVGDVIERIVVGDHGVEVVNNLPVVHHHGFRLALGDKGGDELALADDLVPGGVLTADGVTLEEDGILVAELDAVDVDGVAADGDAVPAATHGAVGGAPGLLEAKALHLVRGGGDGGLLEDRLETGTRGDDVAEDLILGVVAVLCAKVEELPLGRVHVRLDPLIEDELHGVPGHLLAGDVHHGGGGDLARARSGVSARC